MERLKVLMIAPMRPARSGNGLAMRICLFVDAIERFADLDLVVVPVAGEPLAPAPVFRQTTVLHVAPVRASLVLSLMKRMAPSERLRLFAAIGRPSISELLSIEAKALVARIASRSVFDLVLVSRTSLLPLIEELPHQAPILVDLDEDDHASLHARATLAREAGDSATADWLRMEAVAVDRLVARYRPRIAAFFLSSRDDHLSMRRRHAGLRSHVVNNAVTIPTGVTRRHDGRTLVFVGAFGYQPNIDGINWFINAVAPRLKAIDPRGFRLVIAGAQPPASFTERHRRPRVEIKATFRDACAVYARATVAIAPMRAGGGGRTKIIEAAAHGVSCVAHGASANATLARAGWIADNALDFASACAEALNDVAARSRRERLARRIATAVYDRRIVVDQLAGQLSAFAAGALPATLRETA